MTYSILSVALQLEQDIVSVRQRAKQISALLKFEEVDQTRIATAASEIARNAFEYGKGGKAEFLIDSVSAPPSLVIRIQDEGAGISNLKEILDGQFTSSGGMGLGIAGSRKLMDRFEISSESALGTSVVMHKFLPKIIRKVTAKDIAELSDSLHKQIPKSPVEELQAQNQELLKALQEVDRRQNDLRRLNEELAETNRGVVALYAELDEKAQNLNQAVQLKSRFLSNMSHEFRTPVNSTISLARILLNRTDGELTDEQEKQVRLIQKAMENLLQLVNDQLDLAKIESGKVRINAETFDVSSIFGTLRGMFRPLLVNPEVELRFEENANLPLLHTDEGKVSQILRNLISNALKFTEKGEVRVSARHDALTGSVIFSVSDTGIGIAPEDQLQIFEEFGQVEHALQKKANGTGLGLPLVRQIADLLGGRAELLRSEVNKGSTFIARIPVHYQADEKQPRIADYQAKKNLRVRDNYAPLIALIIDDDETSCYVLKRSLEKYFIVHEAYAPELGIEKAIRNNPDIIFLDLVMPGMGGKEVLQKLKANPVTRHIPVVIHSSQTSAEAEIEEHQADVFGVFPKGLSYEDNLANLLHRLRERRVAS